MRAQPSSLLLLRAAAILILSTGACSAAMASKIYQWKDAKGVSHYSDSPPPAQQYKDRQIDNRGEPLPQDQAVGKPVENAQCVTARLNLSLLSGKGAVQQDLDGDGKPDKVLNEDDRANQRNLADAAVKAYCPPAQSPGQVAGSNAG